MDVSVAVKIMIFILLAVFTSWPYFEKIKVYSWLKRVWIGASILALVVLGIIDIWGSDQQAKADKKEISNQAKTIGTLSDKTSSLDSTVKNLMDTISAMSHQQKNRDKKQDDRDKKEDDRDSRVDKLTELLQENKGNIAASRKDTAKR